MRVPSPIPSVQFVTVGDKRLAIVDADDWEALIEWIETIEDIDLANAAYRELRNSDCCREQAGWQKWDNIENELN